jgi:hypothetical protein
MDGGWEKVSITHGDPFESFRNRSGAEHLHEQSKIRLKATNLKWIHLLKTVNLFLYDSSSSFSLADTDSRMCDFDRIANDHLLVTSREAKCFTNSLACKGSGSGV